MYWSLRSKNTSAVFYQEGKITHTLTNRYTNKHTDTHTLANKIGLVLRNSNLFENGGGVFSISCNLDQI